MITCVCVLFNTVSDCGSQAVTEAYARCIGALTDFRSYHIQLITKLVMGVMCLIGSHVKMITLFAGDLVGFRFSWHSKSIWWQKYK